jgi:hypothetical protein
VVAGWGSIRGNAEDREKGWMRKGKKCSLEGEQWVVAQEKEGK